MDSIFIKKLMELHKNLRGFDIELNTFNISSKDRSILKKCFCDFYDSIDEIRNRKKLKL